MTGHFGEDSPAGTKKDPTCQKGDLEDSSKGGLGVSHCRQLRQNVNNQNTVLAMYSVAKCSTVQ